MPPTGSIARWTLSSPKVDATPSIDRERAGRPAIAPSASGGCACVSGARVYRLARTEFVPAATKVKGFGWRDLTILSGNIAGFHILPFLPYSGHGRGRSEEHTSELQSLMRISYVVFC